MGQDQKNPDALDLRSRFAASLPSSRLPHDPSRASLCSVATSNSLSWPKGRRVAEFGLIVLFIRLRLQIGSVLARRSLTSCYLDTSTAVYPLIQDGSTVYARFLRGLYGYPRGSAPLVLRRFCSKCFCHLGTRSIYPHDHTLRYVSDCAGASHVVSDRLSFQCLYLGTFIGRMSHSERGARLGFLRLSSPPLLDTESSTGQPFPEHRTGGI